MAHPFPVLPSAAGGMRRDFDRALLPGGSVWNLLDFIPDELGAMLSGRGGWSYGDAGAMAGATSFKALAYAPFAGGSKTLGIDQAGTLWSLASTTSIGTAIVPGSNPAFHRGKVIIPNNDGTTAPKSYDGTTLGNLAGSPPTGMYASVYKDHAILARSSASDNRIWFSAAGDPTTWDTTAGYWNTTGTLTGVFPVLNAILLFHADSVERLRGTTPPPGTDMVLEPFLDFGCLDAFSVVGWRNLAVFASSEGIYATDGAGHVDLTAAASMKTYWQSTLSGYTTSWRVAGGIYRDHYIVSVNNGTSMVDCFVVDLLRRTMWRFSNFHGNAFVQVSSSTTEELYMGLANAGRVAKISTCWSPSSTVKNDADGTTPAPVMETPANRGWDHVRRRWFPSMGLQKWRWLYLTHDTRDSASDLPVVTLSYSKTPTGSYTAMSPTFAATTDETRSKRSVGGSGSGVTSNSFSIKLAVTGPYASCKIKNLEADWAPLDVGRVR